MDEFDNKNYADYLANIPTIMSYSTLKNNANMNHLIQLCIALEKTHGWDGKAEQQAMELWKDHPGWPTYAHNYTYFKWLKAAFHGDYEALLRLAQNRPRPGPYSWCYAAAQLRTHDFPELANAFEAMCDYLIGGTHIWYNDGIGRTQSEMRDGVHALLSLRFSHRAIIQPFVESEVKQYTTRRADLARAALDLMLKPSPKTADISADDYFAYALRIGEDTRFISLDTAQSLADAQQLDRAEQIVARYATIDSRDANRQIAAIRFLNQHGKREHAATLFRDALTSVQEPVTRTVRLAYLHDQLDNVKDTTTVFSSMRTFIPDNQRDLCTADYALLTAQYATASSDYEDIIRAKPLPLAQRIDAWAGLLTADPAKAMQESDMLLAALEQTRDAGMRTTLADWMGKQLWSAVNQGVVKRNLAQDVQTPQRQPIIQLPDWPHHIADIFEKLVAFSDVSARQSYVNDRDSLYYTAAVMLTLDHRSQRALEILTKGLSDKCVDLGAEKNADGQPTGVGIPAMTELEVMTRDLVNIVADRMADHNDAFDFEIITIRRLIAQIAAFETDPSMPKYLDKTKVYEYRTAALATLLDQIIPLADPASLTSTATDLPVTNVQSPYVKIDLVKAALQDLLTHDSVVLQSHTLLEKGILHAFLRVEDQQLLDDVFAMVPTVIDRYTAVIGNTYKQKDFVDFVLKYIESSHDYRLKPFAKGITEKYEVK